MALIWIQNRWQKWTELTLLHLYASIAINHMLPQKRLHIKLFKHLLLAHPDLFRELRDQQVSVLFINSELIFTFIYNWSAHTLDWYSKLKWACVTRPLWSRNICYWTWIEQEFCYIHFCFNDMKGMFLLELGGIPVHTEYRCFFFLRYEFLKYRNTGVI